MNPDFGAKAGQNPFSLPEGYFDTFPARLQEKISAGQEVPAAMERKWLARPRYVYILGVLLVLIAVYPVSRLVTSHRNNQANMEVSFARMAEYSLDNIDEATLEENLTPGNLEPFMNTAVTREELLQYMQDENIDPDKVIDQL